jgi:hypothetical protein
MENTHTCGVEVFPIVNFRPIDSGNYFRKYNQLNRRYCPRGLLPLQFRSMLEGVATSLHGRALSGIITPRAFSLP